MSNDALPLDLTDQDDRPFDVELVIRPTPDKLSQLENDMGFITDEQVQEEIQAESVIINARIDDEVNTLNSAIESEAATRAETDTSLQNDINTLNDDLTLEISNRTSADEVLQGNIDTISGNLTTEISDRQDADSTLQGNINTVANDLSIEETARINADTTLQGNIDTLSGTVTSNYNTLDGKITDEATARGNADTTLQNNIDTLSGTVTSNYNTLDGKIGNNKTAIDNHKADKNNPHEVTKSQVGLSNVDNTSDLDKPISTATQNALDGKQNTINDLSEIRTNASNGQSAYNTIQNYGDIVTYNASFFATSIQGEKADTALQPNDDISELNNDVGYITSASLPTVNNSTITFQKNNITVGDINLNQGNNETINFDIPTTASDVNALPDTTTINDLTTTAQQNALNSGANTSNIGQIATNTQNISNEVTNRQNADNNLQSQIDALVVASDVFDIVGTYAELQAYDISTVPVNDIIKVLVDSTHNNAATYYRCVENDNVKSWSYIGAEGAYYTKSEADGRFVEQTTTVNGQALSNNITLDAEDVGALPDTTTIGNGTLTIQKNGSTIDSFGANDTGNTIVNITVPTDTGDLTNNAGFITGINSTDITTALGYTPYNSTNPEGYTDNVGTVTSVNNTQPDANGNVTLSIPAAQVNSDWNASSGVAQILNKPTLSAVATSGDYDDLTNKPTIPSVGDGTITITQGGTTKGTFTTNQSGNTTIDLDAGGGSSTDVQINGASITSNNVANIVTNSAYNASSNKIATVSDVLVKQNKLITSPDLEIMEYKPLPSGYTALDYIASSGTQYIDTGYYTKANTTIKAKLFTPNSENKNIFGGTGIPNSAKSFVFNSYDSSRIEYIRGLSNWGTISVSQQIVGAIFTLEFAPTYININGSKVADILTPNTTDDKSLCIFVRNGGSAYFTGRIYNFDIWEDNVLVMHFVPAKRNSDNVVGLYDTVSDTFFTNAGTGTFTAGAVSTLTPDIIRFTNNSGYITNSAITNMQTTSNLVTSVSSSSTDSQYPSAKCVYDIVGDIETLINAL